MAEVASSNLAEPILLSLPFCRLFCAGKIIRVTATLWMLARFTDRPVHSVCTMVL